MSMGAAAGSWMIGPRAAVAKSEAEAERGEGDTCCLRMARKAEATTFAPRRRRSREGAGLGRRSRWLAGALSESNGTAKRF